VLPSTAPPSGAASIKVHIRDICIKGATVYTREQLAPLYADLIDHEVPLQAIYDLAQRITAKYGADGYSLSRAIVPPQAFAPHGATPCLQVVEGYIDHVEWPAAVAKYRDFFTHYSEMITAERPINVHTIERYLLLAGDLPGLHFNASLKPSKDNSGAATLVVEMVEKKVDALATVDNRGTPQRGPEQFMLGATVNNVFHQHEAFTFNYASTFHTEELQYFAANYRQVLTAEGLFAFVNASYNFGHPGTAPLQLLGFSARGLLVEAGLADPIIRTRETNLTVSGLLFVSNSLSDFEAFAPDSAFNRDHLRGFRLKADADWADRLLGINQVNFTYSQGIQGLGSSENNADPTDNTSLQSRANGRVDFEKIEAKLSRSQPLIGQFSAFGSLYGQYAFTPLLVPEQCGYGGRFFGRAFDPSQLLGDHCVEALAELRYDLPKPWLAANITQAQVYGFTDYGKLWSLGAGAIDPTTGGLVGNFDAASAGAGVRLSLWDALSADLQVAKAVHGLRDDTRFFFILGAKY
jgi:hemolysin activation/secretion protein